MKSKFLAILAVCSATFGTAQAVVLQVNIFANATVGVVTDGASDTLIAQTGSFVRLYSSTNDLSAGDLAGITTSVDPIAFFEALLVGSPGAVEVRETAFNGNGTFQSTAKQEVGALGNFTYVLISNSDSTKLGIYQSFVVPALGTLSVNPASNITEDLLGTSDVQTINSVKSGWQLATVPEPSIALLGALGVLGLLRRRR